MPPYSTILKRIKVSPVPLFHDNYCYLIQDLVSNQVALVDPAMESALDATQGMNLTALFVTHHHQDHCGQVQRIANKHPSLIVYGGDERIKGMNQLVKHNVPFQFGSLQVTPIFTPCHTQKSVCYHVFDNENQQGLVFTGDTMFVAGCGRFFEGTGQDMYQSLSLLGSLPLDTLVFCGHEYTRSNLEFAKSVEPDNIDITRKLEWAKSTDYTMPSTIADEWKTNPFLRCGNDEFCKKHGMDPVSLITKLRELKNNF